MASISRRRRSRIGTVRSARLVSALLVTLGVLGLLAIALLSLLPPILPPAPSPVDGTETAASLRSVFAWLRSPPELDWPTFAAGVGAAVLLLWLGYVLRVLAVIAETQLIDLDAR